MKAVVFSDLHLAHSDLDYALDFPVDAEIAIIAGDVSAPVSRSLSWVYQRIVLIGMPVIFIAGNHEHYGHNYNRSMSGGREVRDQYPGVNWLENESVIVNGVRFLGCTLWTDYNLYERQEQAMYAANMAMNDHRAIYLTDSDSTERYFYPDDALRIHEQSREWLFRMMLTTFAGPTVVVTHHCPHPNSVARKFLGDPVTPAFCSDLSDLIDRFQPAAWIHGHTHDSFDYMVGRTRIICNPRGYVTKSGRRENHAFEPFKMIEIGSTK
ncbi:MAG: calcineurin-like phosphoesterase protein [Rhizobium sp.]|nr:calcineurin-like phosphoesterase protein [Rhizobium sp.]